MNKKLSVKELSAVVCNYFNIMKTTFGFNFDLYQALNSMETWKHGNKEKLSIEKALLSTCKLKQKSRLHYIDIIAYHRI